MKNRQTAIQASVVAKVVALSLFLGGSGVGYVYQKNQIHALHRRATANEESLHELRQQRDLIKLGLEQTISRERLELSARLFQLPLGKPERNRIIVLPEPVMNGGRRLDLATH